MRWAGESFAEQFAPVGVVTLSGIDGKTSQNFLQLAQEALFVTICIHDRGVSSDFMHEDYSELFEYTQLSGYTTENRWFWRLM